MCRRVSTGRRHATRPLYWELTKAGIMMPIGTITKGDDTVFRFTYQSWERRLEFMEGCARECLTA
jgi:hypothetical protein